MWKTDFFPVYLIQNNSELFPVEMREQSIGNVTTDRMKNAKI